MNGMETILPVMLVSLVGAFIQAITGFGAPIIMLAFLPRWYPYSTAVTICHLIALSGTFLLTFRYRKVVSWKLLFPVIVTSIIIGTLATLLSIRVTSSALIRALGFFLVAVALFFFLKPKGLRMRGNGRNGVITGVLSGVCNGIFGISAPPTAIYFLSSCPSKEAYLGTMQAFFFLSNIQSIIVRMACGSLTGVSPLPILFGTVALLLGMFLGQLVFHRLRFPFLEKLVYVFVACAGIWNIISSS